MESLIKEQSSKSEKLIENVKKLYQAVLLKHIASGHQVVDHERNDDLELMNTQLREIDERSGIYNRSLIARVYMDIFKPNGINDIDVDAQYFGESRFAQAKFSYIPEDSDKPIFSDTFDEKTTTVTILLNLNCITASLDGKSQINISEIFKYLSNRDYISILRSAILAGSFIIIQDRRNAKT